MFDIDDIRAHMEAKEEAKKEHVRLCNHIKNALTTPSGAILREWLKKECFMSYPMSTEADHFEAYNYRVNARRDLYITLENLLQEGINYVANPE